MRCFRTASTSDGSSEACRSTLDRLFDGLGVGAGVGLADVVAGCPVLVGDSGWASGAGSAGFRRVDREGDLRSEAAKSPADSGGVSRPSGQGHVEAGHELAVGWRGRRRGPRRAPAVVGARSMTCCSRWVIFWRRAPSPDSRQACSPRASESRRSRCWTRLWSRAARSRASLSRCLCK